MAPNTTWKAQQQAYNQMFGLNTPQQQYSYEPYTFTNTTTTNNDLYVNGQVYANAFQSWGQGIQQAIKKMVKFFRVNQLVEIEENAIHFTDPLDELRLKVMRWLDGAQVSV